MTAAVNVPQAGGSGAGAVHASSVLVGDDGPDLLTLYEVPLLREGTGLDLLQWLEASGRPEKVIVVTAYGSPENAVTALKAGAFDYLTKPVDLRQFRAVVASAMGRSRAPPGPPADVVPADGRGDPLRRLVGDSDAMTHVRS